MKFVEGNVQCFAEALIKLELLLMQVLVKMFTQAQW